MNKNIAKIVLASSLVLSLGACSISGPTVKLKPPINVEVEGSGKHCPPGQAKKGRC